MNVPLEIKPGIGLSDLLFGASVIESETVFGKPEEVDLLDEVEDSHSTVLHYWANGFSLFFDEANHRLFCCVEIDNADTILWGQKIFDQKEKQIIELFKAKGITKYESEQHEWGEKRISFDEANIDFYFEKNKLVSINYGKSIVDQTILILPN